MNTIPGFRTVPRTGVIYVTHEATRHGFAYGKSDWANLGQGSPETGDIPGAPPRVTEVKISEASRQYGPVAGNQKLRQAVADFYNATYRRGKKSKYTADNVSIASGGRLALTRLASAVIDAVADMPDAVAEEVAKYLGSDLLCYRAATPEGLVASQTRAWDPVLAWAQEAIGARFVLAQGVVHVAQPAETIAAMGAKIPADPWRLGAVSTITTLTGSALLALALAEGALDADVAWAAAHVDEDWQRSQWGSDDAEIERRAYRYGEFGAAVTVLRHAR